MKTIVVAGGTFCKKYDPVAQTLVPSPQEELIRNVIEICCKFIDEPAIRIWDVRDSLEFTDDDRKRMVEYCNQLHANEIVVIHGTDTMHLTQKAFNEHQTTKKIVLTGAFYPACFYRSDAPFNLGFALACASYVDPGVYVAMNGKLFKGQVKKNVERSTFEGNI